MAERKKMKKSGKSKEITRSVGVVAAVVAAVVFVLVVAVSTTVVKVYTGDECG